jgi:hypothetical protein
MIVWGSVSRINRRAELAAIGLLLPILLTAQNYVFGPNVRVNDDPPGRSFHSVYSPGQHSIAARGDTVYIVWWDDRGGESHIQFARSNDAGQSFLPNVRVDNTPPGCEGMMSGLAVDDSGRIHVSWVNYNPHNRAFAYYARSTDGGQSFLTPVRACDSLAQTQYAYSSLAVSRSGRYVYIARSENSGYPDSAYRVLLSRSTDGGATFLVPDTRVFPESATGIWRQTIAVYQDTIVLIAAEGGGDGPSGADIYFTRSVNGGASFDSSSLLNDTTGNTVNQGYPSIGADSLGRVSVVWTGGDGGLGLAVSTDTGGSFLFRGVVPGGSHDPSLFVGVGGQLYVSWFGLDGGDADVEFTFSTNGGVTFAPPVRPVDAPESTFEGPSTVTANAQGKAFIAWADNRNDPGGLLHCDIYCATGILSAIEESRSMSTSGLALRVGCLRGAGPVPIQYALPNSGLVCLAILDETGRRVAQLERGREAAGEHLVLWDGLVLGSKVAGSGVYFVMLETPMGSLSRKAILVRD